MMILVCGSRGYKGSVELRLSELFDRGILGYENPSFVHGDCHGPDRMAATWATRAGFNVIPVPAEWDKHGKAAGFIRNQVMLDEYRPALVVAFWDGESRGTLDMIRKAVKAGVEVIIP